MKSLTRLDPSSQRPWVRAPASATSHLNSATSRGAPIASGEFAVKYLKRPRAKYSLLGNKNRLPSNAQRMLFTVAWRSDYEVVR
jgi:hypothetical protein